MSFVPNFTATESLSNPNEITLTDTSTGAGGITDRIVYFQLADGTCIVPDGILTDYVEWPYADVSKTFDLLSRSEAINITVKFLSGSSIADSKTILNGFNLYDYIFGYGKLQTLTSKPKIIDNANFLSSMMKLVVNIFCMEVAVERGDDIYSAQEALNRNYKLITNNIVFF